MENDTQMETQIVYTLLNHDENATFQFGKLSFTFIISSVIVFAGHRFFKIV